ncbi:MAG: ABC transporter ATP-binding protein [Deltaproteobacteria bacterium]|nr:ABC transporter ATP-binding protein [Deltaproteobacteria bacterium]
MTTILSTKSLHKHFGGVLAVNDVNAEFKARQLRSIIGPNGAGKTTFINVITGKLPASSGAVVFQEQDVTNRPAHVLVRLGICRTFQITSIFMGLSVFENVRIAAQTEIGGSLRVFSAREGLKNVNTKTWEILHRLELKDKADVPSNNLAHGDQRLLEVAMALAGDPKILFLDEPTAGMSPAETEHIAQLIKGLTDTIAVVLVEHDMDVVMRISDEITVLDQGRIIAEGSPRTIQDNELVKEAYLGHG